ncbi:MAG: glycosyltransferase [Chthoniobacterales bacterium]|nr:glycosyltransferase [Chthoniobacterales bacterium]
MEGWLLRMLKAAHSFGRELDWTFYTTLSRPGRFDDEARGLGATVINTPFELGARLKFFQHLRQTLRSGDYDVLHCHHDIVSAVYLLASAGLPIPRKIVHTHNGDLHVPTDSKLKAAMLREPLRRLCLRLADRIVGISHYTLETFLRGAAPRAPRDLVLYYGIDTSPYHEPPPTSAPLLGSLGLPLDARILLFVSRLVSYKNPLYVVDIIAELASAQPAVCAIFVGAGPLAEEIQTHAQSRGVENRVRVLGWRDDTVAIMQLSDLLVFPRTETDEPDAGREGLGLVVVEAQAAALPALLSYGIPGDAIVISDLCDVLPLKAGAKEWALRALEILARPRKDVSIALRLIEESRFSLHAGFQALMQLHQS